LEQKREAANSGIFGRLCFPHKEKMVIQNEFLIKKPGEIDKSVAEYWKENFDLRYILERDWKTLGPKLEGKIHIYCGDMDNYYLNNAVYLMEDFLKTTQTPILQRRSRLWRPG
jgi:hypothetical protein